jgi:hypothetical protein
VAIGTEWGGQALNYKFSSLAPSYSEILMNDVGGELAKFQFRQKVKTGISFISSFAERIFRLNFVFS